MNLTASLRAIPGALKDAVAVAWSLISDPDDDDLEPVDLSHVEAGRVALEMVMVMRDSRQHPEKYHALMDQALSGIDHPQQMVNVALSLTGMVAVLAKEEDLARFGSFILSHEAEEEL